MKILHLSTSEKQGGAAIAAHRIHTAMKKAGIDSKEFVCKKQSDDSLVFQVSKQDKVLGFLGSRLEQIAKGKTKNEFGLFSYAKYGTSVVKYDVLKDADIVYIHWVQNSFLSLSEFENILKTGKKVVIFLHDMWHITGGCHYSFGCNKYQIHCQHCQMLMTDKQKDISYKQFKKKLQIYTKHDNISFITPSKWLTECVQKSPLSSNKKIAHIPYPLDTAIFKPVDKQFARAVLNLPVNKKIICFGADSGASNPYKGWSYMEAALQQLKEEGANNIEVLVFGSNFDQEIVDKVSRPVHFTGHVHDAYSLMLIYNSIDVYITPTLADNLPQTCLEAMACGTPVVGFNVGGVPDMVEHRKTGYLARYKDSNDLAAGIQYVLKDENLSRNAVSKAREMSLEEKVAEQHRFFLNNLSFKI